MEHTHLLETYISTLWIHVTANGDQWHGHHLCRMSVKCQQSIRTQQRTLQWRGEGGGEGRLGGVRWGGAKTGSREQEGNLVQVDLECAGPGQHKVHKQLPRDLHQPSTLPQSSTSACAMATCKLDRRYAARELVS